MKRSKLIGDVFHSVVPEGTAGSWSVGNSGHTDNSSFFDAPDFEILSISNVDDQPTPGAIKNDVYITYSGSTISGTTVPSSAKPN